MINAIKFSIEEIEASDQYFDHTGSSKSEPNKVAATVAPAPTQATGEQQAANSHKSECCNDKPEKSEKSGCCCS